MNDEPWPKPFGGRDYVIKYSSRLSFYVAITALLLCEESNNHQHNFVVQVDGYILYVSPLTFRCLKDAGCVPHDD
jgi:hypothetical protein